MIHGTHFIDTKYYTESFIHPILEMHIFLVISIQERCENREKYVMCLVMIQYVTYFLV